MEYAILAVIFVVVGFAIWRESKKDAGPRPPAPPKPPEAPTQEK